MQTINDTENEKATFCAEKLDFGVKMKLIYGPSTEVAESSICMG